MQRVAARTIVLARTSLARPRLASTSKAKVASKFRPFPVSLLGGPILFSTAASNTSVPLAPASSPNMATEQTNGAVSESVAPVANGHSKKMHSKVVSCKIWLSETSYQPLTRTSVCFNTRRSSLDPVQQAIPPPSTSPEPTSSLSCSKACSQTASRQAASLLLQPM